MSTNYQKRKEKGLCPRCGEKRDSDRVYCSKCAAKISQYYKETREWCRENHICTTCLKEKTFGDELTCLECSEKKMLYHSRKGKKEEDLEADRKNHKKMYAKRVANEVCTRCGKRKAEEGRKKCRICLEKDNAVHRKIRHKGVRKYREENHLCYICGSDITSSSRKLCEPCYEKYRQIGKNSGGKSEYWKRLNKGAFLK